MHKNMFTFSGTRSVDAGFTAIIRPGIASADELLKELDKSLKFPGYFGYNWNALADCLNDLHWIRERDVIIQHEDVPSLNPIDLRNYLEVLSESIVKWRPEDTHRLIVIFPENGRGLVLESLGD